MAWNPDPKVGMARDVAKKVGCDRVIMFLVYDDEALETVTYGRTRKICEETKKIGEYLTGVLERLFQRSG